MTYIVNVAPLLPAHGLLQFDPPIGDQTEDLRWDERIHVELVVDDDETLWSVLQRAKPFFELSSARVEIGAQRPAHPIPAEGLPHGISFYQADKDPPGSRSSYFPQALTTVDEQGRAHWNRRLDEIPYGDLRRSAEARLLDGDPLRPYFVLNYPQGGAGIIAVWRVLKVVWEVLEGLAATHEIGQLSAKQYARIRKALEGRSVANTYAEQWVEYGGGPRDIRNLIERMPWTPDEFRMAAGLETAEEAALILELFGCVRTERGTYWIEEDEETEILRIAEHAATDHRFRKVHRGDPEESDIAEFINERLDRMRARRDNQSAEDH